MEAAAKPAIGGPLAGHYQFVRDHLLVANNTVLAATTLVAALDFLAPRLSLAPTIVYSSTAALLLLMIAAAAAPALVGRLISGMGYAATRRDLVPMWRRPAWQFAVAILLGVSVLGWASVAKASQGGWIASKFPAARSLQESMLSLSADVADIRRGVEAANVKLDGIVADSKDPQRELVARGYGYDSTGLMKAIQQGDSHAVDLFAMAGLRVRNEGPLSTLLSPSFQLNSAIAAKLQRSMFGGGSSCSAGFLLAYGQIEDRLEERVDLFKRLCDSAPVTARIEDAMRSEVGQPPPSAEWARWRATRARTLALLKR